LDKYFIGKLALQRNQLLVLIDFACLVITTHMPIWHDASLQRKLTQNLLASGYKQPPEKNGKRRSRSCIETNHKLISMLRLKDNFSRILVKES
jgi:hypothetical protein